jgi:hypothetical protein
MRFSIAAHPNRSCIAGVPVVLLRPRKTSAGAFYVAIAGMVFNRSHCWYLHVQAIDIA